VLCLFQAPLAGVKIRAPASQPRQRVGNKLIPGRDYAQQLGLGRSLPAPHAGTHRSADMGLRGRSAICGQVYRVAESAAPVIFPGAPGGAAGGPAGAAATGKKNVKYDVETVLTFTTR